MFPFPAIIGFDQQLSQLQSDIETGNVSHAYLFLGPDHIGKSTVARWFVTQLLQGTDQSSAEVETLLSKLIHPDFLSLDELWIEEQQEDWDEIAKSSNISQHHRGRVPKAKTDSIGIEDVRALQERLFDSPISAYRCCFIRSIERMQPEAAHALLKVVEEPPSRLVFILTAASEHDVLPTLLSRTRTVHFHRLPVSAMMPVLTAAPEEDRPFIAHLAQGAIGTAIRLLNDTDALRSEKLLHGQAVQFWDRSTRLDRLRWLSEIAAKPQQLERAVLHLGIALQESKDVLRKPQRTQAYLELERNLRTNAHRGLVLQHFGLAVSRNEC